MDGPPADQCTQRDVRGEHPFTIRLREPALSPHEDGFYEWKSGRGSKQPFRVLLESDDVFALAGIWNGFEINGTELKTLAILTAEPNDLLKPIQDRMPVVRKRHEEHMWPTGERDEALAVYKPYEGEDMAAYEISTEVTSPSNEGPAVIQPADTEEGSLGEFKPYRRIGFSGGDPVEPRAFRHRSRPLRGTSVGSRRRLLDRIRRRRPTDD